MACHDSGAEHHLQSVGLYDGFQANGYKMLQATIHEWNYSDTVSWIIYNPVDFLFKLDCVEKR